MAATTSLQDPDKTASFGQTRRHGACYCCERHDVGTPGASVTAALFVTNVLVWGFTWIAITYQLEEAPVEVAIAYRFLLAALSLFLVLALSGRLQRIPWRQQSYLALTGLCMFCFNYILVYLGTGYIASGLVALLFSTATIFNAINNALIYRERTSRRLLAGAVLGIAGLGCLFARDVADFDFGSTALTGAGLVLAGTYSFSLGNMVARRNNDAGLDLATSIAWSMAWGTAFLVLYALARSQPFPLDLPASFLVALVYLAIPGSAIGFLAYLELVKRLGAPTAAFSTVVYPVIALAVSTVVEDYRWTLAGALGLALILLGNILVFAPTPLLRRARAVLPMRRREAS
jgi:drug/metabolite transporter (DMT)-like permease